MIFLLEQPKQTKTGKRNTQLAKNVYLWEVYCLAFMKGEFYQRTLTFDSIFTCTTG